MARARAEQALNSAGAHFSAAGEARAQAGGDEELVKAGTARAPSTASGVAGDGLGGASPVELDGPSVLLLHTGGGASGGGLRPMAQDGRGVGEMGVTKGTGGSLGPELGLDSKRGGDENTQSMQILGKMMESGWQDDWAYLTKRLEDERSKRFAADKEKSQAKMSLRAAERDLQEERRLRLELCQLIHDVAADNDVAALKRDLEHVRARKEGLDSSGSVNLEHLDACSVAIQTKLDLAAKLSAHKSAREPKSVNTEVLGLHSRLAVVEKELAAARAREANMHLLLRKLAEDKPLPQRQPKENAQPDSMAIQSEGLLYRLAQRSKAARTCCRRLEYALSAVNEENAIKLRTELDAWDAASKEGGDLGDGVPEKRRTGEARAEGSGGGLEEMVREYPALMGNARVVLSRSLEAMGPSSNTEEVEDWRLLQRLTDAAVSSSDPDVLTSTARALRARVETVASGSGGRGKRVQRAATVECLRLTALLVDYKATQIRSAATSQAEAEKGASRQSDLERAARLQLSAFVRDISLVQDLPFLQSRLAALQAKVTQEKQMLDHNREAQGHDALAGLSRSMVEDMEACVLLLQVCTAGGFSGLPV